MKRGGIWTASAVSAYVGKPRLVVIVQDDRFDATACDDMIRLSRALVVLLGLAGT